MGKVILWLIRLCGAALFVGIVAIAMVYYLASQSLPDYNVTRETQGIKAPVEILRNNANIPHIFGDNDPDVFFGLGYAHAQDRLWQMMLMRRTVQGRLSEVFGRDTLETDSLMRRLDLYNLAKASVAQQDPSVISALQAYANGVNSYINRINQEALGRGSPEFFLFSSELDAWQPADSIALLKLIGVQLAGQLESEVLRTKVSLTLAKERVADILPDIPGESTISLPDFRAMFDGLAPLNAAPITKHATNTNTLWPSPKPIFAGASNAWAAAPKRSATGGTLLANDPHLPFNAPSIWYLARLDLTSGSVIGATIPGIPTILSGRSETFGWGITSSYLDNQDLFVERLNPIDPTQVDTPLGYRTIRERASVIKIKDEAPVNITLQWSENGPILPGSMYDLKSITPPGHVMALGWTLLQHQDRSMSAAMNFMRAKTIDEGLKASVDFAAPSQILTMADKKNVAMKLIGSMPKRSINHQTQGRIPSPGWRAENRWQGMFDQKNNPHFTQPKGGLLGHTNNKITTKPFPNHVSFRWGDSQRIQRWARLFQSRQVHTRESFIEAQLDNISVTARSLLPLIGANLWFTGEPALEGTAERERQDALTLLANWNGDMNEHLPEPLIYSAWIRALQIRLIQDELGPLSDEFTHVNPIFVERVFRDINGASIWCDIVQSAKIETCTDIAIMALDDALIWMQEHARGAKESLRWGDYHVVTHKHPVLGELPLLDWIVNIKQSTSGGDNTLQRGLTSGEGDNPFENVHGAGYRGVYDFSDPDSSLFVVATGQSGHPLSKHYDDLGELWRRGEYTPMSLDPALARAAAVGVTRLMPPTALSTDN